MPEEQAFSVLVKIMYNYGHRDVFKANFQNLHLMFYQLDKLMDVSNWVQLKFPLLRFQPLTPQLRELQMMKAGNVGGWEETDCLPLSVF